MKGEVQVYRNLHKSKKGQRAVYSIRNDKGLVEEHASFLILHDCKMRVSDKGNERVRGEMRKNVHAYIQGKRLVGYHLNGLPLDNMIEITYNPYKYKNFVIKETGEPIEDADFVVFSGNSVWAKKLN